MLQTSHTVSNNGLGSFLEASSEYELAPVGLASFQEQAKKLAEFGRNGDIYIVHAAEGETVVPMEVFDANPKVKELLFNQMREMGLQPESYVVGDELNSINPVTGAPEFFFRKIGRFFKKAVKSVGKFLKKAAPIIIPLAASAFGVPFLGPAFGAGTFGAAFLGGGIGSLVSGAGLKESLFAGLKSGGLNLAAAGAGALFSGGDVSQALASSFTGSTPVFVDGVQVGTKHAASPFADTFSSSPEAIASAKASEAQFGSIFGGDPIGGVTQESVFGKDPTLETPGVVPTKATAPTRPLPVSVGPRAAPASSEAVMQPQTVSFQGGPSAGEQALLNRAGASVGSSALPLKPSEQVFKFAAKPDLLTENLSLADRAGRLVPEPLSWTEDITTEDVLQRAGYTSLENVPRNVAAQAARAAKAANPGTLQRWTLPALAVTGAAYAGDFFGSPKEQTPEDQQAELDEAMRQAQERQGPTGFQLYEENPEQYRLAQLDPYRFRDFRDPLVPTTFTAPPLFAAKGGMVDKEKVIPPSRMKDYPRKQGFVQGPGTGTSDSIPAMLSNGEFVMTSDAVKGAAPNFTGNPEVDRKNGARNMYALMRNFEMRA